MIEPFFAHFFTRAFAHRLLHVVAFAVRVESVYPHENGVFILRFELRLTIDCPGQIPVFGAVFDGDDTAGGNFTRTRIALAYFHDVFDDFVIARSDGRTHPVGLVHCRAELVGIAETFVLCRNVAPHIPRLAASVLILLKSGAVF